MKLWLKITTLFGLLVCVVLIYFSAHFANTLAAASRPFLAGLEAIVSGVGSLGEYLPLSGGGRRELEELRRENAELKLQIERQKVFRSQNENLREILGMRPPAEWQTRYAAVIARDPVTWERRFRIDKGSAHGIQTGAAVLYRQYVIGRVVSVAANSATVATLADRECRISVRIEGSAAAGILDGYTGDRQNKKPVCRINYLPRDGQYRGGNLVYTSGLSLVIPEGLPVGELVAWDSERVVNLDKGIYAQARFLPLAEFDHFRFVTVVSRKPVKEE